MNTIRHVQREIWIKASPETVWRALTVPEERNKWETRSCKIDLVIGGIIQLDYGWGVSYEGIFTEIEYPYRIVSKHADKDLTIWTIEEQEGDVITAIDEIPVYHYEDLERVITEMAPYMDIRLHIYREDQPYLIMMQTIPYGSKLGSIS